MCLLLVYFQHILNKFLAKWIVLCTVFKNVKVMCLNAMLKRSPCPGLMRESWVRIPEMAKLFKRLFKGSRISTHVGIVLNLWFKIELDYENLTCVLENLF